MGADDVDSQALVGTVVFPPPVEDLRRAREAALIAEMVAAVRDRSLPGGTVRRQVLDQVVGDYQLPARLYRDFLDRVDGNGIRIFDGEDADTGSEADDEEGGWDGDGLALFFSRARHGILSADEEVALARRIEEGSLARQALEMAGRSVTGTLRQDLSAKVADGERAKEQFALSNVRLVVSLADRYQGRGLDRDDLVQEGWFGLAHAVELFDYRKGFKFSTYATWWIRQALQRAVDNKGRAIRLPVHAADQLRRLSEVERELRASLGRPPRIEELAVATGSDPKSVAVLLRAGKAALSLDAPLPGTDVNIGEQLAGSAFGDPEEMAVAREGQRLIYGALQKLPARERDVLMRRYGLGCEPETLDQIGRAHGFTRERARQVIEKANEKLKRYLASEGANDVGVLDMSKPVPVRPGVRKRRRQRARPDRAERLSPWSVGPPGQPSPRGLLP